jgi:hypothetical protein
LTVAADKNIAKKNVDGKLVYASASNKDAIQQSIRLLLHAVIKSECTAVVLSALGCGCDGHPPEEVALIFKREIYRVGSKMPYIYFAIQNKEENVTGNFEIFRKILTNAENEATWLSGMDVWNNHVLAQVRQDFPLETLGDAGGPGPSSSSGPDRQNQRMLFGQTSAISYGDVTGGSSGSASTSIAIIPTVSQPYHPYQAESTGLATMGDSPYPGSNVVQSGASSSSSPILLVFANHPPAAMIQHLERPEVVSIWNQLPATCVDPSPLSFLACYVGKLADTAKYRSNWDKQSDIVKIDRGSKGQIRDGPGDNGPYIYGVDVPPTYKPRDAMVAGDVEVQVAALLDYCVNVLNLELAYWRNASEEGDAARRKEKAVDTRGLGNVRQLVLLKIIRRMYGKPKCCFIHPLALYREEDTYYFPHGAAFTRDEKPSSFMLAHALMVNPQYQMMDKMRVKAESYMQNTLALTNAPIASSSSSSRPKASTKALANSAAAAKAMPPPKAPTTTMKRPSGSR